MQGNEHFVEIVLALVEACTVCLVALVGSLVFL